MCHGEEEFVHATLKSPPWKAALPFCIMERKGRTAVRLSILRKLCPTTFVKLTPMREERDQTLRARD